MQDDTSSHPAPEGGFYRLAGHLTLADLRDADDPRALLERLGCTVPHWYPHPDPAAVGCWFGLVHVPDRGWAGVYLGTDTVHEQTVNWAEHPRERTSFLWDLIENPMFHPVADADTAILDLSRVVPPDVNDGWHEGMLLRLVLADLAVTDPGRHDQISTLIALAAPRCGPALAELDHWLANLGRAAYEKAEKTLVTVAAARWPVVVGAQVSGVFFEAEAVDAVLRTPRDTWTVVAAEVLDRHLADPTSAVHAELASLWRSSVLSPGPGAVFTPALLR